MMKPLEISFWMVTPSYDVNSAHAHYIAVLRTQSFVLHWIVRLAMSKQCAQASKQQSSDGSCSCECKAEQCIGIVVLNSESAESALLRCMSSKHCSKTVWTEQQWRVNDGWTFLCKWLSQKYLSWVRQERQ